MPIASTLPDFGERLYFAAEENRSLAAEFAARLCFLR
jgi:hypothetical protein